MKSFSVVQAREVTTSAFAAILDRSADPEALKHYAALLAKGELTVRELIRQLGHSDEFMRRNLLDVPIIQAVHGLYRRFLARAAEDDNVARDMAARLVTQGWQLQIDWFLNCGEYLMKFGDDSIPT